jgi:hypothetical protein
MVHSPLQDDSSNHDLQHNKGPAIAAAEAANTFLQEAGLLYQEKQTSDINPNLRLARTNNTKQTAQTTQLQFRLLMASLLAFSRTRQSITDLQLSKRQSLPPAMLLLQVQPHSHHLEVHMASLVADALLTRSALWLQVQPRSHQLDGQL